MRLSIERIRTLVLVAAVLLLAALGVFLVRAKLNNRFLRHDLPQRLARDITQESNGYTYSHNFGAHSRYKIHASKAVQLKNDRVELHDVDIEIYGENGAQADTIKGDTFEYNQKTGIATAQGPVEMLLTQPSAPARKSAKPGRTAKRTEDTEAAQSVGSHIDVKTSGVAFDRNTGIATTAERLNFSMVQGSGSAVGASYDSQKGYLMLQNAVDLTTYRGKDAVQIHAAHAEFDRDAHLAQLRAARLEYREGEADAAQARILFRDDGSAAHLDATGGFTATTSTGGRVASPTAAMDFDERNQPRHAHLEGGVTMDSAQSGRIVHGVSPTAELDFTAQGELRHAHLERGVAIDSQETTPAAAGPALAVSRTWRSPVADVDFRTTQHDGGTQLEPETLHGTGGVVITSETRRGNAAPAPAKMTADTMTGTFGAGSTLRSLVGTGHAAMEQTTATGAHQTATGDRIQAQFSEPGSAGREPIAGGPANGAPDVQSAELDGHVTLFEQPAAKPGATPQPPLRATSGKAVYEGAGQWLHLSMNPRIVNGALELTADKVDVSEQSGDAFAHNNVKATWSGGAPGSSPSQKTAPGATAFGGNEPAHVIANEAQLNQATEEAVFRGRARLWQQANSVAAPEIVLDQRQQTLTARTADRNDPVLAVLLSAGAASVSSAQPHNGASPKPSAPTVMRVRGGDLTYSDAERHAIMHSGVLGAVTAQTADATSTSDAVDLRLAPAATRDSGASQPQVDRMTATGHVVLTSEGRRGTGEQLVYSGATGDYVLTGTASTPPRMTDPAQGSVTGQALIFHSRDDSVSIEGGGRQTRTDTTAPSQPAR